MGNSNIIKGTAVKDNTTKSTVLSPCFEIWAEQSPTASKFEV